MAKKILGECPECGNETVMESEEVIGGYTMRIERCDGLIAIDDNKPLNACTWSQDLDDYYKVHNISNVSGTGIIKL